MIYFQDILVAPETINGQNVLMAIEPNPISNNHGKNNEDFQLFVTVFAKGTNVDIDNLVVQERLRYVDMKKAPDLWRRAGSQFSRQAITNQKRLNFNRKKFTRLPKK